MKQTKCFDIMSVCILFITMASHFNQSSSSDVCENKYLRISILLCNHFILIRVVSQSNIMPK